MDIAKALHIEAMDLEEELPCYVGSLDLERLQVSLFELLRTCLAHGPGSSAEAETSAHPQTGAEGLGEPGVPVAGRCGS